MRSQGRVLVVDDEPSIVLAVRNELEFEGFAVRPVGDGAAAVAEALSWKPDVVLLDVMLPGVNGFEVCRQLRRHAPDLWIILLTARGQEGDRIRGFESGADDYVVKPFSLTEVLARVRVGLRRVHARTAQSVYAFGDLTIDLDARTVMRNNEDLALTRKEFDILALLLTNSGKVVRRDDFCNCVWGDVNVTDRVIDTHIFALRRKIEPDPSNPRWIVSVRGVGYKLQQT